MCGIFGIIGAPATTLSFEQTEALLALLFRLSESRGKESAGILVQAWNTNETAILKSARSASALVKSAQYGSVIEKHLRPSFAASQPNAGFTVICHSRLVTNGAAAEYNNNQPVHAGGVTMVHNGIVVNVDELWRKNVALVRESEVDTEVLAALMGSMLSEGLDPIAAVQKIYAALRGAASVALVGPEPGWVMLATNTGDLYTYFSVSYKCWLFASERYILEQAVKQLVGAATDNEVVWLVSGSGLLVYANNGELASQVFQLDVAQPQPIALQRDRRTHVAVRWYGNEPSTVPTVVSHQANEKLLIYNADRMRTLKRCSRCILPETFPYISFDADGVCNYCHNYQQKLHVDRKAELVQLLDKFRSKNGTPDVLVALSGGRDSCYGLHLVKKELGLTPITFTYDWGMITDLARRNVARMCGALGVQNILVSADIKQKRRNIRMNVATWLRKPDLGIVPLFMAGDKFFFKVVNQLKKQTGIGLDIWCSNRLENTEFKVGLCGIPPQWEKNRIDAISTGRLATMVSYYGRQFVTNPGYFNRSIFDTARAFMSYYFEPRRNFYSLFDYYVWNEQTIEKTLFAEYDWEKAEDSESTWRIGDGTAPFYNYIYTTALGFSEFDTFRSNQIREGMIDRTDALNRVLEENRPRYVSLRWYFDTIELDFDLAIKQINKLDALGLHH